MLLQLFIDLTANMCLIFTWEKENETDVAWTLLGEDPLSGQPFVYACGGYPNLTVAAIGAWQWLEKGTYLTVMPAVDGLPSIQDVWGRVLGANFSRAIAVASAKDVKIPGVVLSAWSARR